MVLVAMPAIEGSYSHHYSLGASGWDHPDLPALNLANAMLNATESYLYKAVRGSGLAYGANTEVDVESGLVGFNVYRVSLIFSPPPSPSTLALAHSDLVPLFHPCGMII